LSSSSFWVYTAKTADFNDIVTGSSPPAPDDPCLTSGACVAGPGYDQVTGRGSPLVPAIMADVAGSAPAPPGSADVPDVVSDSSGHGNVAASSGGVTFGASGLVGGDSDAATTLDGSSGQVTTGYLQQSVTAYSVEAWIQTTDGGPRRAIVQDRGAGGGGGRSLTLGLNFTNVSGSPFFMLDSDNVAIGVWSPTPVNDGRAHHLVGTWSGGAGAVVTPSQFTLYVDGVSVGTSQLNNGSVTAPLTGLGGTKIGRHDAWGTNLQGTIDEVALYPSVLPAARVQAHFTAGAGYRTAVLADAPAAYYRLDDGS
jgi:hypothetical protein